MLRNPATVTGATLIAGNLTDGSQAITLSNVGTFDVPDSASSSLTIADGVSGGMTMNGWFKVAALPSSTQTIIGKVGSYELKLTAAGKLTWTLTGADTATVTSNVSIALNRWYMVTGVYNGDYSGSPIFGTTVPGASLISTPGDNRAGADTGYNNLIVAQKTIQEHGHITEVVVDMKRYFDSPAYGNAAAVVYRIAGGVPTDLLDQSPGVRVGGPSDSTRHWYTFPVDASVYHGVVGLGMVFGAHMSADFIVMTTGFNLSGGQTWAKNADVTDTDTFAIGSDSPDPFGTPGTITQNGLQTVYDMAIYANYTPTARTGDEGKAVLYVDGVLDNSTAYSRGIADSANNLQHPAGLAVSLKDWMIFDRKLTAEEVAILFASQ